METIPEERPELPVAPAAEEDQDRIPLEGEYGTDLPGRIPIGEEEQWFGAGPPW
jgi:hypothetical protein